MINNSTHKWLLLLLIALVGVFVGFRLGQSSKPKTLKLEGGSKVNSLLKYIDRYYVDTVSMASLEEEVIPEILKKLDPHSVYFPAASLEQANESLEGNFDGIGVTFNMPQDTVIIANVIPSGPSDKANVYAGDRIIKVNDSVIAGVKVSQDSVMKLLRGKAGTEVKLDVKRMGTNGLVSINITRGKIPIKSLDTQYMLNDTVGFIKLNKFSRTSLKEISDAIKELHGQGMTSLIFDLRENSGGFLDQAFAITNEFLAKKDMIVYTEGKAYPRKDLYAKGDGKSLNDKLAVLIDEGSASASEIFAGAIQDNDRGTIIGRRSFGKGLVQEPVDFSDGSGVRLTIARYYTPSGRSIQKSYKNGTKDYYEDIYNRYEHGEMLYADSVTQSDSVKYYTKEGRVVYGGGGITPDVFIPMDTITPYHLRLRRNNVIFDYVLAFSDKHRNELRSIYTVNELEMFFSKNNPFSGFMDYPKTKAVKATNEEIKESSPDLETNILALVARNTPLEDTGLYYILNKKDTAILEALNSFQK